MKISNYLLTVTMAGLFFFVIGCSKNQEVVPQSKVNNQQSSRSVSTSQEEPRVGSESRAVRPLAKKVVSDKRVALVIGNSEYASAGVLRNPLNDAQAVSKSLQSLGFEVTTITNADQKKMERSIGEFGKKLKQNKGVGFFYYAGHGMQFNGENYLLPTDIDPSTEEDVRYDAVPLGKLMNQLRDADNGLNMVVLDACRNNPFARSFRSSSRGLAQVTAPAGTFISYATAPGDVAADGNGENGLFTAKLLKHMRTPGLKLEDVFKAVRIDVQLESRDQQVPWDSSSVTGDFYFMPVIAAPSVQNNLDLGDLEELAAEEERKRKEQQQIKARWANWQQKMQQDYDKVTTFEQKEIGNDLKIESWQLFLKNWSDDNPYSQQDGELRSMAEARVVQWQQGLRQQEKGLQKKTMYIRSTLNGNTNPENWKSTWPSDEACQYNNCVVYVGEVKAGLPHGRGTWTEGRGAPISQVGMKYVGEFKYGYFHGQGTMAWPDGEWVKYVGGFVDGEQIGHGTVTYKSGKKFVGNFRKGGLGSWYEQGTMTWPDGRTYVGEFDEHGREGGQGTMTWPDGRTYVGEWKRGYRDGQGTWTHPDGTVWSGRWSRDEFRGRK